MEHLRELAKGKRKRNFYILSWIVFALSLLFLFLVLFFNKSSVFEKKEIPVSIKISSVTGLKVENESLDFGSIIYGSSGKKKVNIQNNYDFPVLVSFSAEGNASSFLVYEKEILFQPKEKKEVSISTIEFSEEPYGDYSGKLVVLFKKGY